MESSINIRNAINMELARSIKLHKYASIDNVNKYLEIANSSNSRIDQLLLNDGVISDEQQASILAKYLGYPYQNIDLIAYDDKIVRMVTKDFINKHRAIPIKFDEEKAQYIVAIADPFNINAVRIVRGIFGYNTLIVITAASKISKLQSLVFSRASASDAITEYSAQSDNKDDELDEELEGADLLDSPAVKLVESCLRGAIATGASDIHIEPYEEIVRVRYRIDGILYENTTFSINMFPAVAARTKIMAGLNIAEKRVPQDGRIKLTYNSIDYDFRVSTLPTINGEKIVIRILDTTTFNFTRDKLGFLPIENKMIDNLLAKPYGIILLTGPTGCGKSTTLYSFVKEINGESVNVVTVEDPVEYTIEGVNQVQVNIKVDMTFANALRSILRQDPNIIMIGEIRDEETAEIAIRCAITGHLVFSTLHTNDAAGAITRLIDLGVEPYFLTDSLTGIIAQRLVRRLCPQCKKEHLSSPSENIILGINRSRKIYEPVGCPACHNTGYKGRLGVHEVLVINDAIKQLIVKRCSTQEIKTKAVELGMLDLHETCKQAVLAGDTSYAELISLMFTKENE